MKRRKRYFKITIKRCSHFSRNTPLKTENKKSAKKWPWRTTKPGIWHAMSFWNSAGNMGWVLQGKWIKMTCNRYLEALSGIEMHRMSKAKMAMLIRKLRLWLAIRSFIGPLSARIWSLLRFRHLKQLRWARTASRQSHHFNGPARQWRIRQGESCNLLKAALQAL